MTTALSTLEITVITELNSPPAPVTRKSKVFFATSCQLTFTFAKYPCSSGSSSNCTTDQLQMSSKRGGISTIISWILDNSSGTTILMIKKITPVKNTNDNTMQTGRRVFWISRDLVFGKYSRSSRFKGIFTA